MKSRLVLKNWNAPTIKQQTIAVFRQYSTEVFPKFQESIVNQRYEWPNVTLRSNGQVVSSPRNIVDTGQLKLSQERKQLSATSVLFTWPTPYSGAVLTGFKTQNGTTFPGRDWITPVLTEDFPMESYFVAAFKKLGY